MIDNVRDEDKVCLASIKGKSRKQEKSSRHREV
jgi:hypothetical protein